MELGNPIVDGGREVRIPAEHANVVPEDDLVSLLSVEFECVCDALRLALGGRCDERDRPSLP